MKHKKKNKIVLLWHTFIGLVVTEKQKKNKKKAQIKQILCIHKALR